MKELKSHFITSPRNFIEGDVFVFHQAFTVENVVAAKLLMTALGMYEAEINGVKAGEQMFAPGYTYYPRRLLYQEYDITKILKEGHNELNVYLGQGWYCGRFLCENKTQIYGEKPGVSWILKLTFKSGDTQIIYSDEMVKELESPYEYAGEYDGEVYHAGKDAVVIGEAVKFTGAVPGELEKTLVKVKVQEELPVKAVSQHQGKTILDFGQNFAGIVEINPKLLNGGILTIRHGEILNQDGSLYTNNLRQAKATIVYHSGAEEHKYRPRFTYMGFRYMELSGAEYIPGMITAYAVYSQMKRTGYFECGNQMVDQLYRNQAWGQKSNYVEVPTDCPQRDERMGYTGDGQVFALTGAYNFDTSDFWKNFLKDLRLGQLDNTEGYVGATVPATGPAGIGFLSMLGWGNAVTILPEILYRQYGDEEVLFTQYESMKLFVEAEIRKMEGKHLWLAPSLGDWLAPGKDMEWSAKHNTPISNAFIVHDLEIIADVAGRLGKADDAKRYQTQLKATRNAYVEMFAADDGTIAGDYQSAYIMALQYVIPAGALREKVIQKYVQNVRENGMETGFFASEFLLPLLVEAGEIELAYDILLHEECPGWMYQIKNGATTTWERWDALRPDGTVNEETVATNNMVSFNHYAFGSVGEFYYQHILGIQPLKPGYEEVKYCPHPDKRLGWVKGSYQSVKGEIRSAWGYREEELLLEFKTPVNAEVILPDGQSERVKPGTYTYRLKI